MYQLPSLLEIYEAWYVCLFFLFLVSLLPYLSFLIDSTLCKSFLYFLYFYSNLCAFIFWFPDAFKFPLDFQVFSFKVIYLELHHSLTKSPFLHISYLILVNRLLYQPGMFHLHLTASIHLSASTLC